MVLSPKTNHPCLCYLFMLAEAAKKTAPPRPPPPQLQPNSSHTLPYPTQPAVMPMPYAQISSTPYPTGPYIPMPTGYNPYATIAGYPHHLAPSGKWVVHI